MRAIRPSIDFSYTAKPVVYGSVAARLARAPARFAMITGLCHARTSETRNTRVVRAIMNSPGRVGLASCGKVFFQNSDDVEHFISSRILGNPSIVLRTNGSGVDTRRFTRRPVPSGDPVFLFIGSLLFIGRFLTEKDIAEFMEAAGVVRNRQRQARFVAVGPRDPYLPHSVIGEDLARSNAAGVVEFVGGVGDVGPWLEKCSVFILPSYREGTPRSVLEEMITAHAITTTGAPGRRDTGVDGVNGHRVPPRAVQPLADDMERFLVNPALIAKMADASRSLATEVNLGILEAMGL